MEAQESFGLAMIPILERESGMVWGPKSVGRIVRWACDHSGTRVIAAQIDTLVREALWTPGDHHKQWYLEQIAIALDLDLEQLDHEMARAGNVEREPGIAP